MRLYDALQLADAPDLGLPKVDVWYQADLCNVWIDGDGRQATPNALNRAGLRRVEILPNDARRLDPDAIPDEHLDRLIARSAGSLVALDEEHLWGKLDPRLHRLYDPPAATFRDVDAAHDYYRRLVLRIRRRPGGAGLRLGHYGVGTMVPHDHLRGDLAAYRADLARTKYDWSESLKRFADTGLMDVVDVIFPSVYPQPDPTLVDRQRIMLEALADLHDKPLVPFTHLCWVSGPDAGKPADDATHKAVMSIIKPLHDADQVEAVCLWSGPGTWSAEWGRWVEMWRDVQ